MDKLFNVPCGVARYAMDPMFSMASSEVGAS